VIASRPAQIRATIRVPSDKSISHRALILNAIASGRATVESLLESEDVRSTAACLSALGARIDWPQGTGTAVVEGVGLHGLFEPDDLLNCGNSGTTMRILTGLVAGNQFLTVLTGDDSLRQRPMARIIRPLREMGATIYARTGDTLAPLVVKGGGLKGLTYESPVASAQVKSAVLIAGLLADGPTTVIEPAPSRDHTELMLEAMGVEVTRDVRSVTLTPPSRIESMGLRVPGDISSAAPWLVLGACHPDAEIRIENVNVNPTRTGILDVLHAMNAHVELQEQRTVGGEPAADIVVRSSQLHATRVEGDTIPRAIDELPLVALLGAFAEGETVVADAAELRVKESDRIETMSAALRPMGVTIEEQPGGFAVRGGHALVGHRVDARGDHRMGMLAAVAGMLAVGETRVDNDAVAISYPGFWRDLATAAAGDATPAR
jgi:3-phosphoshikimate 1-carboxyvinyltransferase